MRRLGMLLKTIRPLIALLLGLLLAGFNANQIAECALGATDVSRGELVTAGQMRSGGHAPKARWEQWGLVRVAVDGWHPAGAIGSAVRVRKSYRVERSLEGSSKFYVAEAAGLLLLVQSHTPPNGKELLGRIEALTGEHRTVLLDNFPQSTPQHLFLPFRLEVAESTDRRDPKPWLLVLAGLLMAAWGGWRLRTVWARASDTPAQEGRA